MDILLLILQKILIFMFTFEQSCSQGRVKGNGYYVLLDIILEAEIDENNIVWIEDNLR